MPKSAATAAPKRQPPPAGNKEVNAPLDLPKVQAGTSQDMFGDLEEFVEYLRVLLYGPEGSGKSTNAATLAHLGKIVYINAEGGAKKRPLARHGIPIENIRMFPPRQGQVITHQLLDDLYFKLKADLMKDPEAWVGIVIDSSTDIVQGITSEVSNNRVRKARARGYEIDHVDEYFTDVADYGPTTKMFTDFLRKVRDLPLHVVFTALERRDVDKDSGTVTIGPAVTPGIAVPLLGYVDIVVYCTQADEINPFRGLTHHGGRFRVKDRLGILPRIMANPTLMRMVDYANGVLEEDTDPDQKLIVHKKSGKKEKPEAEKAEEPPAAD